MAERDDAARDQIPADVRRKVLVEAGHRCAIPTCRYIETEIHHIVPWAQIKKHEYDNLIALCANCHRRADRGEIDRKSLRLYKLNLRFAHDKFSQIEMDVLFSIGKLRDGEGMQWLEQTIILLRRILDSQYIEIHKRPGGVSTFGMNITPLLIAITPKGREFLKELASSEL